MSLWKDLEGSGEEERSDGEVTGGWIKSPNKIVREWQFLGMALATVTLTFPFNSKSDGLRATE